MEVPAGYYRLELPQTPDGGAGTTFHVQWWVLDWNEPAQGFYRSLGARPEDEWTVWRVDGDSLRRLAEASR